MDLGRGRGKISKHLFARRKRLRKHTEKGRPAFVAPDGPTAALRFVLGQLGGRPRVNVSFEEKPLTTLLYPQAPGQATLAQATLGQSTACPFFSAIPRAVLERRKGRDLLTRDIEVLALLLDYKQRASTEVSPRQATLAGRLGCSADTIQRSVKRLMAAGLLAKTRLRDGKGRVERCVYDLAATLALMPVQAARLRRV